MLRFVVLATFVSFSAAAGYGGSGGGGGAGGTKGGSGGYGSGMSKMSMSMGFGGGSSKGGSYGGGMSGMSGGGGMSGYGGGAGGGQSGYGGGGGQVVQAAVQSKHQVEFRDVPSSGMVQPTTIEVGANSVPLNILFRSASSNLNIQQAHDGAQGSTQESQSEDEPHVLKHQVTKPIIQEVRELITPSRKIVQEIQPVQEEILTIVARGQDQKKDGGYGGGSGMSGGSQGGYGGGAKMGGSGMSGYGGSSGGGGGSSAGGGRKGY